MSTKSGQLLWNRKRIVLDEPSQVIDTGLRQVSQGFGASSDGEPSLGVVAAPPGPVIGDPSTPASRVQVIPLLPLARGASFSWTDVRHGEPFVDPMTDTVKVEFFNDTEDSFIPKTLNVLFWDPHTSIGPGQADTYHTPEIQ